MRERRHSWQTGFGEKESKRERRPGTIPRRIDKMSELGFESIHDAASRSHTVDASLSAEIEVLLATSGYTAHSPKSGGASPPRGPHPDSIGQRHALRPEALSRALLAADPLHAEEALRECLCSLGPGTERRPLDHLVQDL